MERMDLQELRELVEFLKKNGVAEFELNRGEQQVKLKFESAFAQPATGAPAFDLSHLQALAAAGAATVPTSSVPDTTVTASSNAIETMVPAEALHEVKSPIVGTFYESSAPGSAAFVKVGDTVEVGQVLCIVEAMKLMNEIESDVAGEVVKLIAKNGQPVEYGQPLFAVRAR